MTVHLFIFSQPFFSECHQRCTHIFEKQQLAATRGMFLLTRDMKIRLKTQIKALTLCPLSSPQSKLFCTFQNYAIHRFRLSLEGEATFNYCRKKKVWLTVVFDMSGETVLNF